MTWIKCILSQLLSKVIGTTVDKIALRNLGNGVDLKENEIKYKKGINFVITVAKWKQSPLHIAVTFST